MRAETAVAETARRLKAAGVDNPRLDARLLVAHVLGRTAEYLLTHGEHHLDDEQLSLLERYVVRREGREPMSHILGRREFWGLSFFVTADTLDPRPDSETLVETAIEFLRDREPPLEVLDLGTGTGCLLLAILSEFPEARGLGIDISPDALDVARINAADLGMADRVSFQEGSWGQGVEGSYDLIVSNPPYIPECDIPLLEPEVSRHEPHIALSGGSDGLTAYRALIPDSIPLLKAGGLLLLEFGMGQGEAIAEIISSFGLKVCGRHNDIGGVERCICATLSPKMTNK